MKTLQVQDVILPVGPHPLLEGLSRVLHINRKADLAVIIPIDLARSCAAPGEMTKKKKRARAERRAAARKGRGRTDPLHTAASDNVQYYFRGPRKRSLRALESALEEDRIVKTQITLPPLVTLSDEEIQKRFPPRPRDAKRKAIKRKDGRVQRPRRLPRLRDDGTPLSATLDIREERLEAARPILDRIREVGPVIFEGRDIATLVGIQEQKGFKRAFVCDAVNRHLALGCGDNALLGGLEKCGGQGPREQTQRIGRRLGLYKAGKIDEPGMFLSEGDKKKIRAGWRTYVEIEKLSRREAWLLFSGAFYSRGHELHQGVLTPQLLPVHERPSFMQFCYWGPREGNKSAFEAHLKPQEWEQKYRALLGTVRGNIPGVGHTAFGDSTRTNAVLVSMLNRLNAIGTAHRICFHDAFSDVVPMPYCGLEAPSERTSMLAVYLGASSVRPVAERLNLELTEDQIPPIFFLKYVVDNTDLRTAGVMQTLKHLGSSIEYVETNRPERKGPVEAGHHETNARLDDKNDGSNYGRRTERGEEAAAISACWTFVEYYAELLLAIAYHNTHADASAVFDAHPCRAEMRRAGVAKTRMAIYRWAKSQPNRDCSPAIDRRVLRSVALPTYRARVFGNGAHVMRPDRGKKREYVKGMRFIGPRLMATAMLERARQGEEILLDLKVDPHDPSHAWFSDAKGLHELVNANPDPITQREATLQDYLANKDDEGLEALLGQDATDQADFNYVNHRAERNLEHRNAKKQAIEDAKAAGKKVTKRSLKTGLKGHREAEAERIKNRLDLVHPTRAPTRPKQGSPDVGTTHQETAKTQDPPAAPVDRTTDAQAAIRRFRERKAA